MLRVFIGNHPQICEEETKQGRSGYALRYAEKYFSASLFIFQTATQDDNNIWFLTLRRAQGDMKIRLQKMKSSK